MIRGTLALNKYDFSRLLTADSLTILIFSGYGSPRPEELEQPKRH